MKSDLSQSLTVLSPLGAFLVSPFRDPVQSILLNKSSEISVDLHRYWRIVIYLLLQICTFQIFYKYAHFKSFTNVLQIFFKCLANFSFFVNNRDKLIQSLAVFWLINISIAINHYFSGASAATQKVSVISKSSRYIWSLHILTDPTRSSHIPSDLSRS